MPLVAMKPLLEAACAENRAVGAFSIGNMEMVMGAVAAAEKMNTPIILQIAQVRLKHAPLHLIAPLMLGAAKAARVDIAVHFDHGLTQEGIQAALDYGFTSVMFDGSLLPYEQNVQRTTATAQLAHAVGATCEAELGVVGGSEDGSHNAAIRFTDAQLAADFCTRTGVDALAVAIGNAHGHYPVTPQLRFDVLDQIRSKTDVPLVLHGGSGITWQDFRRAIDCGIRKVNIATASFTALTTSAANYLQSAEKPGFFGLNEAMVESVYQNVCRHIYVFNNKGEL